MQKIFIKYLSIVMVAALLSVVLLNYALQTRTFEQKMLENAVFKMDQIFHTVYNNQKELDVLVDSLHEDYLTRARAFSYMIEQNPALLTNNDKLQQIRTLLKVDELHVIDENGILTYGTVPKYFGFDFAGSEQTSEFLRILRNPASSLVQDIRPNGAEQKIFQYIGVTRRDRPGIVQVGLEPWRQMEARKRNGLPYIFSRLAPDEDTDVFAVDIKTQRILAHTDVSLIGKSLLDLGFNEKYLEEFHDGAFFTLPQSTQPRYFVIRNYPRDIVLGVSKTKQALYAGISQQMLFVFIYLALTFLALLLATRFLLRKQIVGGVHEIMRDLTEITDGNLDTVVKVNSNPEFEELSLKINKMVKNLLGTTVKISRIIDLVEAPIGAFEYKRDMNRILATDRLRHVLGLSEIEARRLYRDKQRFITTLTSYMELPEPEEEDVYRINGKEQWIRLRTVSDEEGVFGIVSDVTKEIIEKKRIKQERDRDELTGLYGRRYFSRAASALLCRNDTGLSALLMFDLDAFKCVNDTHGHSCGDDYLRATAAFLAGFRDADCVVGRRSGDEFYLYVYNLASRKELYVLLDAFFARLEESPFLFPDGSQKVIRISAGIAWRDEASGYESLLAEADEALYAAKADPSRKYCEIPRRPRKRE